MFIYLPVLDAREPASQLPFLTLESIHGPREKMALCGWRRVEGQMGAGDEVHLNIHAHLSSNIQPQKVEE